MENTTTEQSLESEVNPNILLLDEPLVNLDYNVAFPGKSTKESMQIGVCQGVTYEINGYVSQMNTVHEDLQIVDCSSENIHFGKEVKNKIFARQKLVLEGLNYIIQYNAKK